MRATGRGPSPITARWPAGLPPALAANTAPRWPSLLLAAESDSSGCGSPGRGGDRRAALETVEMAATLSGHADGCGTSPLVGLDPSRMRPRAGRRPNARTTLQPALANWRFTPANCAAPGLSPQRRHIAAGHPDSLRAATGYTTELGATYGLGRRSEASRAGLRRRTQRGPNRATKLACFMPGSEFARSRRRLWRIANQMGPSNNSTHPHIADTLRGQR